MGSKTLRIGNAEITVDDMAPTARIRRAGAPDRLVSWPQPELGWCTPQMSMFASNDAVWVIHQPTSVDTVTAAVPVRTSAEAVRIGVDGDVATLTIPPGQTVGVTRHGYWTVPRDQQARIMASAGGAPVSTELTLHAPGREPRTTVVDRPVWFILDADDGVDLFVQTHAPARMHDVSSRRNGVLRVAGELPTNLSAAAARPVPDAELMPLIQSMQLPVDGDELPGVARGPRRMPPAGVQQAAIDEARRQFGSAFVSSVVGAWPDTVVAAELPHPDDDTVRLRREWRVFDAEGRVSPVGYLDVYIMEDVGTGRYPRASAAVDGIVVF